MCNEGKGSKIPLSLLHLATIHMTATLHPLESTLLVEWVQNLEQVLVLAAQDARMTRHYVFL